MAKFVRLTKYWSGNRVGIPDYVKFLFTSDLFCVGLPNKVKLSYKLGTKHTLKLN